MDLGESDPRRSNLSVISGSIIFYFLAGGFISGNQLHFPLVNVGFSRVWVLFLFVWVLLFWSFIRFWQSRKGLFVETFNAESRAAAKHFPSRLYLQLRLRRRIGGKNGFFPYHSVHKAGCRQISWHESVFSQVENKYVTEGNNLKYEPVKGFFGLVWYAITYIQLAFLKPGFGDVGLPYALFGIAVSIGFVKLVVMLWAFISVEIALACFLMPLIF